MNIRPNVEYTREEVAAFRDSPELAGLLLTGYVFTLTIGGNFMLVPWNQAAGGGHTGGPTGFIDTQEGGSLYGRPVTHEFDKRDLPSAAKRTPQQRLESLLSKVGDDLRFYLSGQSGREVTGEETRKVAAGSLQEADDAFEQTEAKRIVRTTGNPYA